MSYEHHSTQFNFLPSDAKPFYEFAKSIPNNEVYNEDGYGREDQTHVTVLYGIHDYDTEKITELVRHRRPVRIKLGKTKIFQNDDYDVLYVEVKSTPLHSLHHHLRDNLPNSYKFPEYNPHVTLAYLKKGKGKKYKDLDNFEGKELTFDRLSFNHKDGKSSLIQLTGVTNPWTKKASEDETKLDWTPILTALKRGETGGEENPWIRTRHRPPGGSSAYGPLQLTAHTVRDYYNRKPEMFSDVGEFPNRFLSQADKFLEYGAEPLKKGYEPRWDYGGEGQWGNDPVFQQNYLTIGERILRDKLGDQGNTMLADGVLSPEELAAIAKIWHGSPVDKGYIERMQTAP